MKKKSFIIVVTILIVFIIVGIAIFVLAKNSNKAQEGMNLILNEKEEETLTAEKIINMLKEKNTHIGKIIIYNEETDTNNLLGRPNQYTSKIQFEDDRISQEYVEENNAKGGTIEVFENEEDMQNRKKYIESISSQMSMFAQYIYSKGNVLLRLDEELTPQQAEEYEKAFYEILK